MRSWKGAVNAVVAGDGAVDVGVAQHRPAGRHAPVVVVGVAVEVGEDGRGGPLGLLDGGQVGGVGDQDQLRVRDPLVDGSSDMAQRGGRVLGAADDEGGRGDGLDLVAQVHLADGRAAPGVALVGRVGHALGQGTDERAAPRRASPALNQRGVMASTSAWVPSRRTRSTRSTHRSGGPEVGRRAAQHQRGDALGRVDARATCRPCRPSDRPP